MQRGNTIFGDSILNLLDLLKKNRIVVKFLLLGGDYERLTIVTGVNHEEDTPFFLVDYPEGLEEAIQELESQRVYIEFLGPDRVLYAFRTIIEGNEGQDVRVRIPSAIKKIQRRKHFRIVPPLGTCMIFTREGIREENSILNLSVSGGLISPTKKPRADLRLYPGDHVRDLEVVNNRKLSHVRIKIKETIVKRAGRYPETGHYYYALQFLEWRKKDIRNLEKWLNIWQREILQKRSLLKED